MRPADDRSDEARIRALEDFSARAGDPRSIHALEETTTGLLGELEEAGVEALLLKGPALARLLYRRGEQRTYLDVDLLVAPGELARARAVLVRLGYENISERAGVDDFLGVLHAETWSCPHAEVDLHWRLPGSDAPADWAWTQLYAGRQTIDLGGRQAAVLGRPGLALHLATHAAQHGPDDLKALGDLERGLARWTEDDWRAAARLADSLRATEAFAAGLRLLPEGATMARRLELPSSAELSWKILNRAARPRGTFHVRALTDARGWRARANVMRRSLFPPRAWIAAQHPGGPRGGVALLAGYVLHLLRAPVWAARAWRFDRGARRARDNPRIDA